MTLFKFKEKTRPRGEYKEDILAMLEAECRRRHDERRPLELRWMLSTDFFTGHQYCDINPYNTELEDYTPPFDYMERRIQPHCAPDRNPHRQLQVARLLNGGPPRDLRGLGL